MSAVTQPGEGSSGAAADRQLLLWTNMREAKCSSEMVWTIKLL